jgi:enterobacterial common antigen flippase
VTTSILARIRWIFEAKSSFSAILQTFLARILILFTNLATGVICSRLLGPEGRGIMVAISLWPGLICHWLFFGMSGATIYSLKNNPKNASEYFSAALLMSFGLGCLAAGIGIIGLPFWLPQYSSSTILLAQYLMLSSPFALVYPILNASLECNSDFVMANRFRIFSPLWTLSLLLLFYISSSLNAFTAASAYLSQSIICCCFVLPKVLKTYPFVVPRSREPYQKIITYGFRVYAVDLLDALPSQIVQTLAVSHLSTFNLGLYGLSMNLSRNFLNIQGSIMTVLFPKIVGRSLTEVAHTTGLLIRFSLVMLAAVGTPIILHATGLLTLIYGNDFIGAERIFQILVLESMCACLTWSMSQILVASGQPTAVNIIQLGGLVLTGPLMFMLIPQYGLEGAGIAFLLPTVIRLILSLALFPKIFKTKFPGLILTRTDIHELKKRLN